MNGPSQRAGAERRVSERVFFAWVAAAVASLVVLAYAITAPLLLSLSSYTVHTNASPSSSCWFVTIDVDFIVVLFDGQNHYTQCGGDGSRAVALGRCRERILVRASLGVFEPSFPSELSVEILQDGRPVDFTVLNATEGSPQYVHFICGR